MRKAMKALKMMVAALMIAALLCGGALAASHKANVITSKMVVYDHPDFASEPLGSLPQGTAFTVNAISSDGNWAKVSFKGKTGYASMQNILFDERIPAVAMTNAPMRFVTKASYKLKLAFNATVAKGTPVYVVGHYNGYLLIENASGDALGIVHAKNFKKI